MLRNNEGKENKIDFSFLEFFHHFFLKFLKNSSKVQKFFMNFLHRLMILLF